MTHNQILWFGHKLVREHFIDELKDRKKGFFSWQYSDSSIEDGIIEYEFFWDSLSANQILLLGQLMLDLKKYNPILKGGRHDETQKYYQIQLILIVKK